MTATQSTGVDRPILVGVDGTTAAESAVLYAAREADRTGAPLRILHVIPELPLGAVPGVVDPAVVDELDPRLQHRRDHVLGAARAVACELLPGERVSTAVVTGERVSALLTASEQARLVVLGAPWHSAVDRLVTGTVVGGVAARAAVPVIAVPAGWSSASEHGRVVVAVKAPDAPEAGPLVTAGVALAAERKARLSILHAWEFPVVYDNMIATTFEEEAWNETKRQTLAGLVADAADAAKAEVAVDYRLVHGQGAHAVVAASEHADLVVISRRRHAFPFGHLGAAGRAVLRESRCPVVVLPPRRPADEPAAGDAGQG